MFGRQTIKRKRHALFYLPEKEMVGVHQTRSIVEGTAKEGESVRLHWDSNNLNIPAKVIKLSGEYISLFFNPLYSVKPAVGKRTLSYGKDTNQDS